jgi:hypothetical protein
VRQCYFHPHPCQNSPLPPSPPPAVQATPCLFVMYV